MYCKKCGNKLDEGQQVCLNCGTLISDDKPVYGAKSKIVAGVLGICLGSIGIHNFYLGYMGKGMIQLLLTLLSCGFLAVVSGVWGLIEGILILTGSIDCDASGNRLID